MKYLLDTCTFIYLLMDEEDKLSLPAKTILKEARHDFFVSAVSVWEIVIKTSTGKLVLKDKPDLWILDTIKQMGIKTLSISPNHTLGVARLPLHHKDPFDRLLIAQAGLENLSLVSPDSIFGQYDISLVW